MEKFQIEALEDRERSYHLSEYVDGNENVYTMLVGRNAAGKSRMLSKLANYYLFSNRDLYTFVRNSINSQHVPHQVVAVSNSRFDRFPDPFRSIDGRNNNVAYHYLGVGTDRFFNPLKVIAKVFETTFDFEYGNRYSIDSFFNVLDYTGFLPSCTIELRRSKRNLEENEFKRHQENNPHELGQFDFYSDILPAFDYFETQVQGKSSLSIQIDQFNGWKGDISPQMFSECATLLIKAGVLRISRVLLFDKKSKDRIPFQHASSGQQCMLLMFLGMAGVMRDNSLVCIDEPEISLHPKWQAEFIGLLQTVFSVYKGCHFFIATHSPQVVSGLVSSNGFVADLENLTLLRSFEYARKSADFQLSEIFHEPGFKNEYLIRILLVMLSKIKERRHLSDDDYRKIRDFELLRSRLDEADPVRHLLDQVQMLAE